MYPEESLSTKNIVWTFVFNKAVDINKYKNRTEKYDILD